MTRPLPDAGSPAEPPPNLFRHVPFQRFWGTRVMSSLGFQILSVAIGWHVYALTHSAFALGLVGLAQFVPMFALTLVVGQVADRYDRRRIAMLCQTVEACVAGAFLLGSASGWLTAPGVYALAMIVGTARAFESPSVSSLLPAVVPRGDLPRATALSTSANQAAQILGPACGGLLYGLGAPVAFGASVAAFALAALMSGTIPLRSAPPAREPVTLRSVFSGIAFIRREPAILGALSLDLFAVLFGGATALLPIYARDILQVGPWGLGALRAAPAFGALAGTLWLARFPLRGRPGRAMFGGVIAFGIATIVFGLSRHFMLSLVARRARGARRVGRDQRRRAAVARATAHAGRDARARERGQRAVHRHVEPARRIRVGRDGRVVGRAGGDRRRRRGDDSRRARVDAAVSAAHEHDVAGA